MTSHINHDATNPNTKIVWATDEQMAHPEWRKKSIEKWGAKSEAGLSLNFVALRSIEQDEEITIDYGSEWEKAWQKHLRSYNSKNDEGIERAAQHSIATSRREAIGKHHVPAFELNQLRDLKLQTMEEGDYESEGLRLFCRKPYLEMSGAVTSVINDDDDTILDRSTTKKNNTLKVKRKYFDWNNNEVYPCRIRSRYRRSNAGDESEINDNHDYRYLVEVFDRSEVNLQLEFSDSRRNPVVTNNASITQEYFWALLFDAPRDAFYFEDQKKHRHHHQTWSFRHDIRIPDDIFPDAWRNNKKD